jgi:hypothetical protein
MIQLYLIFHVMWSGVYVQLSFQMSIQLFNSSCWTTFPTEMFWHLVENHRTVCENLFLVLCFVPLIGLSPHQAILNLRPKLALNLRSSLLLKCWDYRHVSIPAYFIVLKGGYVFCLLKNC